MIRGGLSIGRYFGIQVKLHWSWLIIFAIVTWVLAGVYFPNTFPEWSLATYVVTGVVTSLLFFLSVLVHEMAHSIIARRNGLPIDSITLFLFGGVSQLTEEPTTPELEFRMSLAGPLTSLAIGGLALGIWYSLQDVNEPVAAVAFWLGWINVVLAGFNLIPGFPLDGGRVLRSVIWWRSRNLHSATKIASGIGRGVGFLFIFGGIFLIFAGVFFTGIWLAFIGWFLESAASSSYRQLALKETLQGHSASEIMVRECPSVPRRTSIQNLVQDYVLRTGRRCFPVVEDGHVLGLVTMHNIKDVPKESWPVKTAEEAMTPFGKMKAVGPQEDLTTVMNIMTREDINQVPVVERDQIVGMVSRDNLLNFINARTELQR